MDDVFKALSDSTRREILTLTRTGERRASDIADAFAMSRPAVSQHLKVLLEAGLLTVRRQGTERFYQAQPDRMTEVRDWLESFWPAHLGLLKIMAETEEKKRRKAEQPSQTDKDLKD
ncbi:MAG: metalloregulator ArsR/SmtB family transcription factor [Pseudomonadota bacterium]